MYDTPSVFDVLAQDDTDQRVAQRRALALAQTRVENRMGQFLRGARSEEEFEQRLALVLDDFDGAVRTASTESGYDKPEHVSESIKQHYAAAVNFEETPAEEEEDEESRSKASSADSDSTPRVASQKVGEWLLTPHTAGVGPSPFYPSEESYQPPRSGELSQGVPCPACGGQGSPDGRTPCPECGGSGVHDPQIPQVGQNSQFHANTAAKHHMDGVTDKEDRQYEHIKENYLENGKDEDWAKEMAARTVNKEKSSSFLGEGWTVQAYGQEGVCPSCGATTFDGNCSNGQCQGSHPQGWPEAMPQQGQFDNRALLDQMSQGAQAGVPGMETHPDYRRAADQHGNTGLGAPEPKIDKSHKPLKGAPEGAADKTVDPTEPITPKNRTENDLDQLGDIEHESLPAASGDNSGFSTETPGGKGDHTKTFPKGDQTNPVTHETMSSSGFPSTDAVQSALTRL